MLQLGSLDKVVWVKIGRVRVDIYERAFMNMSNGCVDSGGLGERDMSADGMWDWRTGGSGFCIVD